MKQRRAQIVVDDNFQYQVAIVGILVSFILINTTLIAGFFVSNLVVLDLPPELVLAIVLGLAEIICLIIVFFLTLKLSHRIAGPLYQVKRNLKEIGEGDLTIKTKFRKTDHFQDLGTQLTKTTEQLCERLRRLQETTEMLTRIDNDSIRVKTLQRLRSQLGEFNTGVDEVDYTDEEYKRLPAQLD